MQKTLGKELSNHANKISLDTIPEQMQFNGKVITKDQIKKEMEKFVNQNK